METKGAVLATGDCAKSTGVGVASRRLERTNSHSEPPRRLRFCSAAPGVLDPLLAGRSETEAEAQGAAAAGGGLGPVPIRGMGVVRRVAPGTTA